MITQEERKKIFSLYWGQKVLIDNELPSKVFPAHGGNIEFDPQNACLRLQPLSQISDEDATEVAVMFNRYRLGANKYKKDWKVSRNHLGNIKCRLSNDHYDLEIMIGLNGSVWSNDENIPCNYKITSNWVDFLRSKGYALPAYGHSIEELVNEGVFTLKIKS